MIAARGRSDYNSPEQGAVALRQRARSRPILQFGGLGHRHDRIIAACQRFQSTTTSAAPPPYVQTIGKDAVAESNTEADLVMGKTLLIVSLLRIMSYLKLSQQ
jgi:hypothetical protein